MTRVVLAVALVIVSITALSALAQEPGPPPMAPPDSQQALMAPDQLDQLLGPIALYPDPLLSELFPAATLPSQIVQADRYISDGGDPNQIDSQPWDPSIQAIARYPQLLKWMDDNIAWTTEVGQAFVNQQQDVMDSIQRLRGKAQVLGNLQNTPQESVVDADGAIEIEPTDPDQIYLPVYPPTEIYDEPGIYCTFGVGWPIGPWLAFDWDWHHHHIIHWGPDHPRPGDWWHRSPQQRIGELSRGRAPVWHPTGRGFVGTARPVDRGWAPSEGRHVNVPVARPPEVGRAPNAPARNFGETRPGAESRPPIQSRPASPPQRVEPRPVSPPQRVEPRPVSPPQRNGFERPVSPPPQIESRPASPPPRVESRPASPPPQIESRPAPAPEPRASSGGFFGGPQGSSEARQSSQRGVESRGAPVGGGGGNRKR